MKSHSFPPFENKNVLVTGGTKGIGAALVDTFLQKGASVYTCARHRGDKKNDVNFLEVDFKVEEQFQSFLKRLKSIKVDILINNAGINRIAEAKSISEKDYDEIQLINVKRPLQITQAVLPWMEQNRWGRIVNITSIFGNITKEKRISYSTSKFALKGMTKALAVDLAKSNILVNSVAPGFIDTELTRRVLTKDQINELTSQVPLKRLGTPLEVANLAVFLSSDQNTFITGQDLLIDGGFTCV